MVTPSLNAGSLRSEEAPLHATDQIDRPEIAGHRPRGPGVPRSWSSPGAALAAIAVAALISPRPAAAAPPCRVTVSADVAFGTYDVFDPAPRDATARIRLVCPQGPSPQIVISKGSSPTYAARTMTSGTDVLRYNLYLDPSHQVVWGDGTDGSSTFVAPHGNVQATVYARIPPGQDVAPGAYSDTLVVTVFL